MKTHKKYIGTLSALVLAGGLSSQTLAAPVSAAPVQQEQAALNQSVGIGSGFVVGALLGGPLGAFIGTGAGHLFADHVSDHQETKHKLARLEETEQAYAKLLLENEMMRIAMQEAEVNRAETVKVNKVLPVESQIQFLTASDALQKHYLSSLDTLAEAVKATPGVQVQLFGYADRRGDSEYNQALSEKRVESVKQYLMKKGVQAAQFDVASYGEAQPVQDTQHWEHDFFDRRVVIRIQPITPVMTAANP